MDILKLSYVLMQEKKIKPPIVCSFKKTFLFSLLFLVLSKDLAKTNDLNISNQSRLDLNNFNENYRDIQTNFPDQIGLNLPQAINNNYQNFEQQNVLNPYQNLSERNSNYSKIIGINENDNLVRKRTYNNHDYLNNENYNYNNYDQKIQFSPFNYSQPFSNDYNQDLNYKNHDINYYNNFQESCRPNSNIKKIKNPELVSDNQLNNNLDVIKADIPQKMKYLKKDEINKFEKPDFSIKEDDSFGQNLNSDNEEKLHKNGSKKNLEYKKLSLKKLKNLPKDYYKDLEKGLKKGHQKFINQAINLYSDNYDDISTTDSETLSETSEESELDPNNKISNNPKNLKKLKRIKDVRHKKRDRVRSCRIKKRKRSKKIKSLKNLEKKDRGNEDSSNLLPIKRELEYNDKNQTEDYYKNLIKIFRKDLDERFKKAVKENFKKTLDQNFKKEGSFFSNLYNSLIYKKKVDKDNLTLKKETENNKKKEKTQEEESIVAKKNDSELMYVIPNRPK